MENSPPKIAFFIIDYTFGGGVERVTADLISLFQKNHLSINHLLSLYKSGNQPEILYPEDLVIDVLNPPRKKDIEAYVFKYLQKIQPDVLIFQGDNMSISLAILRAAKRVGVKAIPQYHGSPYAYLKKYSDAENNNFSKIVLSKIVYPFKKNKLKKFVENSVNGLVCVSEGSAKELRRLFLGKEFLVNITTIHNPIPIIFSSVEGKEKVVTFVSRLESKHKNSFLILKAWQFVEKTHPGWKLKIFGSGILENKFERFISSQNLKNAELKGFVKNVRQQLENSAISVSTSNSEGFSMAVAEAIAAGNAVAVTDSDGGVSDMVLHGKTGLVSPKNNAEKLARSIMLLIEDESLRKEMAMAAQDNLQQIISENTAELWQKLF